VKARAAIFRDACLLRTNFSGADLSGAVFSGANLICARWQGAKLDRAQFSPGADPR
jgi:uncharacterized protein YjbI with pentapeptide repeats